MKASGKVLAAVVMMGVASAQAQEQIVLDGSTTVGPIGKAFAEFFMKNNPGVSVTVSESGSGNGAKGILNGTCHAGMMSRFMKDTEFAACAEKGVMPVAHVVALDGLPILVHPSNPVEDLTVEQIRKIYTGEIANWRELGGPNMEIVFVSRDTNSGTYETFNGLVMQKQEIAGGCEYVGSNGAVRQRVQSTPAAIGYAGLGFVDETVKALKVNGITPNEGTVISGDYPIARALFIFTNGYPKLGSPLYKFMTIHLSPEGEEIVKSIGFVPVTQYGF
ncbi:MAG: phosphate ABC transporter substrate-binding protein [Candidatus Marinimicrobia bacterium]|nr:phosphate ABC transporter substrate-binding protein [Candidatus Neomarinimicrobiota bacterium]